MPLIEPADAATETLSRAVAALYGLRLNSDTLQALLQLATTVPDGMPGLLESAYAQSFGHLPHQTVAAMVVAHMGLPAELTSAATTYLQSQLDGAGLRPAQAIVDATVALSGLTADPTLGSAAMAFNQRLDDALAWSADDAQHSFHVFADALVRVVMPSGASVELPPTAGATSVILVDPDPAAGRADWLVVQAGAVEDVTRVELRDSGTDVQVRHLHAQGPTDDVPLVLSGSAAGVDHIIGFDGLRHHAVGVNVLTLQVMELTDDTWRHGQGPAAPLANSPFDGFSFTLNGQLVVLADPEDADPADPLTFGGARTYEQLLVAVQRMLTRPEVLAEHPDVAHIQATLGSPFYGVLESTQAVVSGQAIVLTGPEDGTARLGAGSFFASGGLPPERDGLVTSQSLGDAVAAGPVTAHVMLDDVGRGGSAGGLLIGAEPGSEIGDAAGIERWLLTVERSSQLTTLLTTGAVTQDVIAQPGAAGGGLQLLGDDQVPGGTSYAMTDVRRVDMSAMTADVAFDLQLTAAVFDTYGGTQAAPAVLRYLGGAGSDRLFVQVAPVIALHLDAQHRVDLLLSGGEGDDQLELHVEALTADEVALANQPAGWARSSLWVDAGTGADQVRVPDFGAVTIHLGAGDDVLRVGDGGATARLASSQHRINPGAGDDLVVLGSPSTLGQEVIVLGPDFGHDRIENFGPYNQFDLSSLGVVTGGAPTTRVVDGEPQPGGLGAVEPGSVVITIGRHAGPDASTEAAVARFYADVVQAERVHAVYIAVDDHNIGTFYDIVDPAGSGPVTASLIGSIDLAQTAWTTLTDANFV
jgi:hypothetical protein